MVDSPDLPGKMCDWESVEAVAGARQTLAHLAITHTLYVASGAQDSSAQDIQKALQRVDMAQYIRGYFCPASIGIAKGAPAFLPEIMRRLGKPAAQLCMVGDSWDKDILPALAVGMQTIWYCPQGHSAPIDQVTTIRSLTELCQ
ncbi:HAD family hydrolase [Neptunicella sp.]|uniref:HAD family hydrolase n=1 Tax=Neptunicella sp. TaxID=2125986 RepID=UPI003F69479D